MVWWESKRTNTRISDMVVRNLAVGRASRLQGVVDHLAHRPASGQWDPIAFRILQYRYNQLLRTLVLEADTGDAIGSVDELEPRLRQGVVAAVRAQVDELLAGEEAPSVATLLVLEERLGAAIARDSSS